MFCVYIYVDSTRFEKVSFVPSIRPLSSSIPLSHPPSLHYLSTKLSFKKRKLWQCSVFKRKASYSVYYWLVVLFLVVAVDACKHTAYTRFACFPTFSSMLMMIYPRTGNPHNNNLIVLQKKMWHDIACKYLLCSFYKMIVEKKYISCYQLLLLPSFHFST